MRLVLHTAAYWLMLTVRDAVPKTHALAKAAFATLRIRLLKIGARSRKPRPGPQLRLSESGSAAGVRPTGASPNDRPSVS